MGGRDGLLILALSILVFAGASDAFSGAKSRVLAAEGKGDGGQNSHQKASPSPPTPIPSPNSVPVPVPSPPPPPLKPEQPAKDGDSLNGKTNREGVTASGASASVSPPLDSVPPPPAGVPPLPPPVLVPPPPALIPPPPPLTSVPPPSGGLEGKSPENPITQGNDKKDEKSKGSGGATESGRHEATCAGPAGTSEKCKTQDFVACLQRPDDSKELFLIVQNSGENNLTLNIKASIPIDAEKLIVAKHSAEKISVSSNVTKAIQIVLNAGKGVCNLEVKPSVPDWYPFQQFPDYAIYLTPIYGAYFLLFTMIIAGGTWACCKLGRKRRRGDAGIPYQQIEMGTQPQSSSVLADANATDGWDHNWDDDWDEEEAVGRPSERQPVGDRPSNGHTLKPSNKDGWDDDWDE